MPVSDDRYSRTRRLLGTEVATRLNEVNVIVFGVGGVGSWCAECLVRTGITHLTIVDVDNVSASNINRQLMATTSTIGQAKVDVLKQRLLDINPEANIIALKKIYTLETASEFGLEQYDYIIDAIDSLKDKAHLILHATSLNAHFYSSMGAALKINPQRIGVSEFWKVHGCPLAKALRNIFKKNKQFPKKKFKCVFSDELLTNKGEEEGKEELLFNKVQVNGSLCHITSIFGMTLAGLIIQDINTQNKE